MSSRQLLRSLRGVVLAATLAMVVVGALPRRAAAWYPTLNGFASPRFEQVWRAADLAIQQGRTSRSWTWGPQPWFYYREVYKQSPSGMRLVQYFDKSRMEINNPENTSGPLNGVTNGLIVVEMVSGRLKLGDDIGPNENQQRAASTLPVAGDLPTWEVINEATPYYESFASVATTDNGYRDPNKTGQRVGTTFKRDRSTGFRQDLANQPGTDIVAYEPQTGHNIPRVFRDFMNAGPVAPIAAFGYPITDPYWIVAQVGGQDKDVLVQLFERRTLTYTPSNPAAFRVEMGNVGQHYFQWRYGVPNTPWAPPAQSPLYFASLQDGPELNTYTYDPATNVQRPLSPATPGAIPYSAVREWHPYDMVYGEIKTAAGKRALEYMPPPRQERLPVSNANDYEPAISPDGYMLAFVSDRDGNPDLYLLMGSSYTGSPFGALADPRQARVMRLTDTQGCAVGRPSWLPDGSGLVYESNCQGGNWELYRANLSFVVAENALVSPRQLVSPKPGEAERLTNTATNERWPRVSPDGSQIAFFSDRDGNNEIYTASIDGTRQTRLTNDGAADEGPTWSPDGTRIVFNSNRDGDHEIFIINRDGSGLRQLTYNTVADGYAVWGS